MQLNCVRFFSKVNPSCTFASFSYKTGWLVLPYLAHPKLIQACQHGSIRIQTCNLCDLLCKVNVTSLRGTLFVFTRAQQPLHVQLKIYPEPFKIFYKRQHGFFTLQILNIEKLWKTPKSPFNPGKNLPLVDNPWDVGNLIDDFITWNLEPAQTPQLFAGSSSDTEWRPTTKQLQVTWCCWSGLTWYTRTHTLGWTYGITLAFFYDFKFLFAGDVGEDICSQEAGHCCCELNELTYFFQIK